MIRKKLHHLGPFFGLLLFAAAIWALHLELKQYHYQDIVRNLKAIPARRLFMAVMLTSLNYLVLTGYDRLAFVFIRRPLEYSKIALASFIGYAFSNNIGMSMIAGSSVRYRLYSAWGLTVQDITRVVIFYTLTLWLGLFTVSGTLFLVNPVAVPELVHLPFRSLRTPGFIFLLILLAYFVVIALKKSPVAIREFQLPVPSLGLSLAQIALSSLDWALAGSVLYVLMPPSDSISYPTFLTIYLAAQVAGMLSQVPGGLGIFETVVLSLLSPALGAPAVLGSLLAYRGIYYLLPLSLATLLLGIHETLQKREGLKRFARVFGRMAPEMPPRLLSFAIFAGGVILLFSGATPEEQWRLEWLRNLIPLPLIEVSHFLGSLAGVALLFLARGLQQRIDAAYLLTIVLLALGIVVSLLKGLDYEEAVMLALMLSALLPCRNHFYRKASLFRERFTMGWVIAIALVIGTSIWLGMFSYKHVDYARDLWWHFAWRGDAPRFLRATVGAVSATLFFALARLLRPAPPQAASLSETDRDRMRAIVNASPATYANLALLADKTILFSENREAFVMYGVEARSWIAMGDPVGPQSERIELIWRFRELSDRHGGWCVFYEVGQENLSIYLDLGLTPLKLGEEARVPLDSFALEGKAHKGLRYTLNRIEKEGCGFEIISQTGLVQLLPELKSVSDAWLQEKNTREKRFSLGRFNPEYLTNFPAAIVRQSGRVVAFANLWLGAAKYELSIDLMRYLPEAPENVMEYLFIRLLLWGKESGYRWFNLGMAPLSGLENHPMSPLWHRLGAFVFQHGEHFYNFQGLRRYKEKFDPVWEPKYLAVPGSLALPRIFANIASLISGGKKGVISK